MYGSTPPPGLWECASILWLFRMRALRRQLQVFTDSETVFLGLLTSASQYYTWQLFLSQMHEIFTLSWPTFPETPRRLLKIFDNFEDFRTLPKIKCPQMFSKTFEHFRSYLKDDTFSVLWYDFVRTQKRTQSHHVLRTVCPDLCVRREKLSLMREIDVFRICVSGVRNGPWCVRSMSLGPFSPQA